MKTQMRRRAWLLVAIAASFISSDHAFGVADVRLRAGIGVRLNNASGQRSIGVDQAISGNGNDLAIVAGSAAASGDTNGGSLLVDSGTGHGAGTSGHVKLGSSSGTSAVVEVGDGATTKFVVHAAADITFDPAASINFGGNKITNLGTPASSSDAATKGYVDSATPASPFDSTSGVANFTGHDNTTATAATFTPTSTTAVSSTVYATYSRDSTTDTSVYIVRGLWYDNGGTWTVINSIASGTISQGTSPGAPTPIVTGNHPAWQVTSWNGAGNWHWRVGAVWQQTP